MSLVKEMDNRMEGEKFLRQLDFFDPRKHNVPVHIVGAGGIGSFAALALAKLGLTNINVYDFDTVEAHNQPNQLFGPDDVGDLKVSALRAIVGDLTGTYINDTKVRVEGARDLVHPDGILIAAVDSMAARRLAYDGATQSPGVRFFIYGRLGGEVIKVLCCEPRKDCADYEATLHDDATAAELPCTRQVVIDVAFFMAAMITRAVRRYLVLDQYEPEVVLDVANSEFLTL